VVAIGDWLLYLVAFLFGIGLTNHQALLFIMPFLLVAIGTRSRELFGRAIAFCLAGAAVYGFVKLAIEMNPGNTAKDSTAMAIYALFGLFMLLLPTAYYAVKLDFRSMLTVAALFLGGLLLVLGLISPFMNRQYLGLNPTQQFITSDFIRLGLGAIIFFAPLAFLKFRPKGYMPWARLYGMFTVLALGVAFLLYMPFASEQNPPMNWGYPRTIQGFKHAVLRGQYEKISVTDNIKKTSGALSEQTGRTRLETYKDERAKRLEALGANGRKLVKAQELFTKESRAAASIPASDVEAKAAANQRAAAARTAFTTLQQTQAQSGNSVNRVLLQEYFTYDNRVTQEEAKQYSARVKALTTSEEKLTDAERAYIAAEAEVKEAERAYLRVPEA